MADNLTEAVKEIVAEKAKPVVVPAAVYASPVEASRKNTLEVPARLQGRKWNDHLEHERIELLRGVLYKAQKQIQALSLELSKVRELLKKHVHTANGDVALALDDTPAEAGAIGPDPTLD